MRKFLFMLVFLVTGGQGFSQMQMQGVENSVGFQSSGTSIEPASTSETTPMIHGTFRNWTTMFHGNVVIEDIQQSGPRGDDKFFSTSWLMPMATRQFGNHSVMGRVMLSFEPATVTKRRYPLL